MIESNSLEENDTRTEIQDAIKHFVKILNVDHELPMKEIISEMLLFSSIAISEEGFNIDYSFDVDDEYEENYSDIETAKQLLMFFKNDVDRFVRKIEKGVVLNEYEISHINERMDNVLIDFEENMEDELSNELDKIKKILIPAIKKAKISLSKSQIHESLDRNIHNISSVKSIITHIDKAESFLESVEQLAHEDIERIQRTKEKCSLYRAKKKMLDAEVAENSGNNIKANKLKAEAKALMMQDWKLIMKSDNFPDLNNIK